MKRPTNQALKHIGATAPSPKTQATEHIGHSIEPQTQATEHIGHWRSEIGTIGLELAILRLGLESFLASTCCRSSQRRPSGLPEGI